METGAVFTGEVALPAPIDIPPEHRAVPAFKRRDAKRNRTAFGAGAGGDENLRRFPFAFCEGKADAPGGITCRERKRRHKLHGIRRPYPD